MKNDPIYIVTDAEFDGPVPGRNSMLSFASVAVAPSGEKRGEFEAALKPLEGATSNPETMAFWKTVPEAYVAATLNPEQPSVVMPRFVNWVRSLGGNPVFAAHPVALDGTWMDFYLQRFANEYLLEGPWKPNRLFKGVPFCLASFAAGRLGWSPLKCEAGNYPDEWCGNQEHTHKAIDDARGYANLLVHLMKQKSE